MSSQSLDLNHLGVKALPHLNPAVGEKDRPVHVDAHKRETLQC